MWSVIWATLRVKVSRFSVSWIVGSSVCGGVGGIPDLARSSAVSLWCDLGLRLGHVAGDCVCVSESLSYLLCFLCWLQVVFGR